MRFLANGEVYTWGNDWSQTGVMGLGSTFSVDSPTKVEFGSTNREARIKYIHTGEKHAVAIDCNLILLINLYR